MHLRIPRLDGNRLVGGLGVTAAQLVLVEHVVAHGLLAPATMALPLPFGTEEAVPGLQDRKAIDNGRVIGPRRWIHPFDKASTQRRFEIGSVVIEGAEAGFGTLKAVLYAEMSAQTRMGCHDSLAGMTQSKGAIGAVDQANEVDIRGLHHLPSTLMERCWQGGKEGES